MSGNIVLIEESIFGVLSNGEQVKRYILKNKLNDFSFTVISFGASIQSINIIDKDNNLINVACGYDKLEEYLDLSLNPYFGATVGRVANRISNAEFKINGKLFKLEKNNGNACLHGGRLGLARRNWSSDIIDDGVRFTYLSPDGEDGFPGVVTIEATYRLDPNKNNIIVEYKAISEELTPINLTNHTFFNLTPGQPIYSHLVKINADSYLDFNPANNLVTGKINEVNGSKYDFREYTKLAERMKCKEWPDEGFDNYFITSTANSEETKLVASVKSPSNGLRLDLHSNQLGLHFYTGNYLNHRASNNRSYQIHEGFCLETMNYPDSVNHENFPSCLLAPEAEYIQKTIFSFSLDN